MATKINALALAAAVAMLVLVLVSWFVPWWTLRMGDIVTVNVSPVNINVSVLGTPLTIPLVWAMSLVGLLTLTSAAVVLLVYSLIPNKSYSKKLLGFGYKKPLIAVLTIIISLFGVSYGVGTFAGVNIPVMGSGTIALPESLTGGQNVSVDVSAGLQWPFYFAIAVAILCVAARLYNKKTVADSKLPPPPPPT